MGLIQLLPDAVASQVAAGEVVERPASVVKELVENALDAGARHVEVAIQRGGSALVRVRDDGRGMDRPDALMCLERHATSKLRSGADLAAIATLGFRGEAVPSIASVSKFRLATREPHALAGTEVIVHGGKVISVRDAGDAAGTTVEARALFFNLPARRKFLRSEQTESAHVEALLHALALGHEGVGFTFLRDGREVFRVPPAARLADRVRDLLGADALAELTPCPPSDAGAAIRVRGFVGRPGVSRATRAAQLVFVNGRPVENPTVSHAVNGPGAVQSAQCQRLDGRSLVAQHGDFDGAPQVRHAGLRRFGAPKPFARRDSHQLERRRARRRDAANARRFG